MQYGSIRWGIGQVNISIGKNFCSKGKDTIFVLSLFTKVLTSLMQIPVLILSVNIKMSLWPFYGREASLNNLVPGTTWGREKLFCLSGCLLIITEGLFFPVVWEASTFLFLFNSFSFPNKRNPSVFWIFLDTS